MHTFIEGCHRNTPLRKKSSTFYFETGPTATCKNRRTCTRSMEEDLLQVLCTRHALAARTTTISFAF